MHLSSPPPCRRFSAFFVKGREFLVLGFLTASVIFINSVIGIVFFTGVCDTCVHNFFVLPCTRALTDHQISLQAETAAPPTAKPCSSVLCLSWSVDGRVEV